MKIFSNKLFFFFFSLLFCLFVFIGNVKASTNFVTEQFYPINYYIQKTGKTVGDFRDFVLKNTYNFSNDLEFKNYIILLENVNNTNRYFTLYYLNADEFNLSTSGTNTLLFNAPGSNSKYRYVNYQFNSDYTQITQVNDYNYFYNFRVFGITGSNNILKYMILSSNLNSIEYIYTSNGIEPITFDNGQEYSFGSNIPLIELNKNYNLPIIDYFSNPLPTIQPPYNIYKNGYTETTFLINNYTLKSNVNGYYIRIINNTNGNIQGIAPDISNPDREITLTSYENTNYTIQIYDKEYNIIQEYSINANINYSDTNFNVEITNIDNNTKEVFYKYIISDNTQNYTCYHSINNNEFIQDLDCTDTSTVYYNLTMPNNGNLAFKIEDENNNIVYEYNQNIVFNVSDIFISFQDNYDNNYLNLNVLINRYQTNDIVEYSINNSSFIQANLEDYSSTQNIKNFYVNNLNNNDILVVRVKRNNEIITYATYKANYLKNNISSSSNFNLNNFFDKLNINNINSNLRNYITQIGNIFINSKLGNLIILEFFIMVVCWVLKTIRK